MEKLTYVTGNYGKYVSVKEQFEDAKVDIDFYDYDFEESEINNIEFISWEKASEAYEILKKPCFVADSGFYIDNYPCKPGFPGAFVKRSGISSNIDDLLEMMKNVKDRSCRFVDCLTFFDGNAFYTFHGTSKGTLSKEKRGDKLKKAKSNLWYVFIPENHDKTLAEMTDEERKERENENVSATQKFINWYENVYTKESNPKQLIKKL